MNNSNKAKKILNAKKIINEKLDCCENSGKKEGRAFWSGIIFGLVPHIGCIAFIIFTVLGVTAATTFFKPLLISPYFFYILLSLSLIFTTISAAIFLKVNGIFSILGLKRKWKYLSILYGTTILTNLFMFMVIFPYATNLISNKSTINRLLGNQISQSSVTIQVVIPCSGHAPLITEELNKISGVKNIEFKLPNIFIVSFDSTKTSKDHILSLEVFKTYKANVLNEAYVKN